MVRSKKNKKSVKSVKSIRLNPRSGRSFKSRKRRSYNVVGGSPPRRSSRTRKSPDLLSASQDRDEKRREEQLIRTRITRKENAAKKRGLKLEREKLEAEERAKIKKQRKLKTQAIVARSRDYRLHGRPGRRPLYKNINLIPSLPLTRIGRLYPHLIPKFNPQTEEGHIGSLDPVRRDHLERLGAVGAIGRFAPVGDNPLRDPSQLSRKTKFVY